MGIAHAENHRQDQRHAGKSTDHRHHRTGIAQTSLALDLGSNPRHARDRACGPTLDDEGGDHHGEGCREIQIGVFHAGDDGKTAQENRRCAPQAHPGNKGAFAIAVFFREQAHQNCERTGQKDQDQRNSQCGQCHGDRVRRRHHQAQHQEQPDLCQPGHAIRKSGGRFSRAPFRRGSEGHTRQIGRQKA